LSKPIVLLAIIGITLGTCVMILSVSITSGFQSEIRNKVIGFGSHLKIEAKYNNSSYESFPMLCKQDFNKNLLKHSSVRSIQNYAYKPAIVQTKNKSDIKDIEGIIFKGIGINYNLDFFNKNLNSGKFPIYTNNNINDSIVISKYLANKLKVKTDDKLATFFIINNKPKQRNLIISGIYETGLENFDNKFAFIDLNLLRRVNSWGSEVHILVNDYKSSDTITVEAYIKGNKNVKYSWNINSYNNTNRTKFKLIKDTIIRVITSNINISPYSNNLQAEFLPDTAFLEFKIQNKFKNNLENFGDFYINDSSNLYINNVLEFATTAYSSGGSGKYYTGGIEILLNEYEDLFSSYDEIDNEISPEFEIKPIVEEYKEIFSWLNMLDMNVYIILTLMIIVAIINMTSAILVMILEKTKTIGILKSIGTTNWFIRKIFMYKGAWFITLGLVYGNILAYLIIIIQNTTGIITLPQESYFVSEVPMHFPLLYFVLINIGAFVCSFVALILPSYLITRISPVEAIRIE